MLIAYYTVILNWHDYIDGYTLIHSLTYEWQFSGVQNKHFHTWPKLRFGHFCLENTETERPRDIINESKLKMKQCCMSMATQIDQTTQFDFSIMGNILEYDCFDSVCTKNCSVCPHSSSFSFFLSLLEAHTTLSTLLNLSGLQCKYPRHIITPTKCS